MNLRTRPIRANFAHAPRAGEIEILLDAILLIGEDGAIVEVALSGSAAHAELGLRDDLFAVPPSHIVIPGLVDLHVHAPQYPQLGEALDVPLEVWLGKYTFPLEARYADPGFACTRYTKLVADLLRGGTTTALYFATVHREASLRLAQICLDMGQRALVGKVVMDNPASCPEDYRDSSAEAAVSQTRGFIADVRALPGNDRVLPVITPRFIPSCTDEALSGLGRLAAETGAHIQTHCSESDWAHGHAIDRFGKTDSAALDGFGLLTRKTILAHSVFITDDDMGLISRRGAGIAHCALSNNYFAGAVFPLRRALEKGLNVGLGTDISGGPSASMFEAARATVAASRQMETGVDSNLPRAKRGVEESRIDMRLAFHLATAGGGVALDLPVGQFSVGYQFDAIFIDTEADQGTIRLFGADPTEHVEQVLYTASIGNLCSVYVSGQHVA